jgi:membrane-associated protease RseP (regulator of RpoE activity)
MEIEMRKVDIVRRYQGLVAKRLLAATLASLIATTWAVPASFGQERKPAEAESTGSSDSTEETTAAPTATATAEITVVAGQPLTATLSTGGEEPAAEKVTTNETTLLGKYWLGLGLKKIEGDLATYLGNDDGMFIFEIYPDSPAAKAEWQVGDILISFNGKDIGDFEALLKEINAVESKSVKCVLLRKGEKLSKKITPEVRPNAVPQIEVNSDQSAVWTFEALPEQGGDDNAGKKTMIFRAVPSQAPSEQDRKGAVFMIEGGEFKFPEGALKAIPELEGALKSLKGIELTQIGKGSAIVVDRNSQKDGKTVVDQENISVSVVRKSEEDPGTYTVIINGEKFEGSLDELDKASEKVKKALENVDIQIQQKTVTLDNGIKMTITPKVMAEKAQKEIELILKKVDQAKEQSDQQKKDEPNSKSAVVTESRIVIASTDDNGEVKVTELDGGNVLESMKLDDMSKLIDKLPAEVRQKIEEAKKKAEAAGKKAAIAVGKVTDGNGKMQLLLQPVGEDKSNALRKEVEDLRGLVHELQKQIEELKKK